ncbi:Uncharacterised protein [Mycobacteroides abscessus subsp. massiliense]|nr:Uncharacterised protein [Mycobacteroides abscessus subsp. massiliense]
MPVGVAPSGAPGVVWPGVAVGVASSPPAPASWMPGAGLPSVAKVAPESARASSMAASLAAAILASGSFLPSAAASSFLSAASSALPSNWSSPGPCPIWSNGMLEMPSVIALTIPLAA